MLGRSVGDMRLGIHQIAFEKFGPIVTYYVIFESILDAVFSSGKTMVEFQFKKLFATPDIKSVNICV